MMKTMIQMHKHKISIDEYVVNQQVSQYFPILLDDYDLDRQDHIYLILKIYLDFFLFLSYVVLRYHHFFQVSCVEMLSFFSSKLCGDIIIFFK